MNDDLLDGIDFDFIDDLEKQMYKVDGQNENEFAEKRACISESNSEMKIKQPFILYGEIIETHREDEASPSFLCQLLPNSQSTYLDLPSKQEKSIIKVILQDDWTTTVLVNKQRVNIILLSPPSDLSTIIISNNNNAYLIISPDNLHTVTNIAISYTCLRRAVLTSYISSYQETKYSIFGRLRHDLMEYSTSLLSRPEIQKSSPKARIARFVQCLHEYIIKLLKTSIFDIYSNSIDICECYEALHFSVPAIILWIYICSGDMFPEWNNRGYPIKQSLRSENTMWSPIWGMKGIIDNICTVHENGNSKEIPFEFKTGSEDAVSHGAQVSLYSILMSQSNKDNDFILYDLSRIAGYLVYMKSPSFSFQQNTSYQDEYYQDIKNELELGKRGSFIVNCLKETIQKTEQVVKNDKDQVVLQLKPQYLNQSHIRALIMRRNLIVSYIERDRVDRRKIGEAYEKKERDIEDIEDIVLDSNKVPEKCGNSFYCEHCSYLPFCSVIDKVNLEYEKPSQHSTIQSDYSYHMTKSMIDYFKKWYNLIQIERRMSERDDEYLWLQSSKKRQEEGNCILHTELVGIDDCSTLSQPHTHCYSSVTIDCCETQGLRLFFITSIDLKDIIVRSFTNGCSILLSSEDGNWGIAYGVIESIEPQIKQEELVISVSVKSETLLSNHILNLHHFYRIDKFKTFDISTLLVNNLVTFVNHKQASSSLPASLDTFFSQRGFSANENNTTLRFPSLQRYREILIDHSLPIVLPQFTTIDSILSSLPITPSSSLYQTILSCLSQCNPHQLQAILLGLNSQDLCIIQGLPGSGKTHVITILILLLYSMNKRILISSHTHTAIDNILQRLLPYNLSILRLGELNNIHTSIRQYHISQLWSGKYDDYNHILNQSKIIGATVYTNISQFPRDSIFDVCIVDEAGQITEPSILQVLLLAKRTILVGDSKQLPPLVQSSLASHFGMDISLIARLSTEYSQLYNIQEKNQYICNLSIQYRMNQSIMDLANYLIYNNMLQAASPSIANAQLRLQVSTSLPQWLQVTLQPSNAIVFLNTDDCLSTMNKESSKSETTWSRHNLFEITIIHQIVDALIEGGVQPKDIGVISPYAAQVLLLSNKLASLNVDETNLVEVSTVDKFQGRDKECIIVSLVRSNYESRVGSLLKDWRRLNVSFTRAKRKLILIGSESTLSAEPLWLKCIQFIQKQDLLLNLDDIDLAQLCYVFYQTNNN